MRRRSAASSLLVLVALSVLTGSALGERTQSGDLVVSLNGNIAPLKLPRDHPAPVSITLESTIGTTDETLLPRVTRVRFALAGDGLLRTRGLPVCPLQRLRTADVRQAIDRCGPALVGDGSLRAALSIPRHRPSTIRAHLLAFNGRTESGGRAILLHGFSGDPPVSLVLPLAIHRRSRGDFGTVLAGRLRPALGPLLRLSGFRLRLHRRFFDGSRHRSYVSASCPVPDRFTAGFLTFARATYSFAEHRPVTTESVRSCRAG